MATNTSSQRFHRTDLSELLNSLKPGSCQHAVTSAIDETLGQLVQNSEQSTTCSPIVIVWEQLPRVKDIREDVLQQLAIIAARLWPDWYGSASKQEPLNGLAEELNADPSKQKPFQARVIKTWLHAASQACRTGRIPLFEKEFSSDTQLQQLILTLGDRASALVMAVRSEFQAPQALNNWARMGERLASILHVPVLLLIPRDLQNSESLEDAIGCKAIKLFNDATDASVELADSEPAAQSAFPELIIDQQPLNENKPRQQRSRTARVESYVRPIQGKPHPSSQGEQVLWQLLQQDPELVSLFRANWPVETTCGSKYLADLLWQQGQIVVEVDGYYWHSMASVFNSDRQRDYELQLTGFLTLRLPHDEVVANPQDALEKVRRFVHLRD